MANSSTETQAAPLRLPLARLIPSQRSFSALAALAAAVALLVGLWMWGQAPDYRVLYTNLSGSDGGAIIDALQQMNVPYKFADGGGALMVPADKVYEVRLRLASLGLPKGSLVGFDVLENQKFGTSQFVEQVNYQRALEGELARSVQSLAAVQSARVHLAIPKQSVFLREQQKPSASVLVTLYAGRTLAPSQVDAIAHLVSSSVPDLEAKRVTVVDQNGNLLTATGARTAGLDPYQLAYLRDVERGYARRIEAILLPITGPGNVHAQVTADVDFSQTENVAETYKPNEARSAATVRSKQTSESTEPGFGATAASGVPGALSNQPPPPASAPLNAPPGTAAAAKSATAPAPLLTTRKESTVNYELDKTIRHTRQPVGAIRRLSVAVVVNDREVTGANGKTSYQPLPRQEMAQITALVKEVMGFDKQRADSLNVVNTAFSTVEAPAEVETPFWKRPDLLATAGWLGKNLLIAIVALFVALRVVAPVVKSVTTPPAPPPAPEGAAAEGAPRLPAAGYENNLQAVKQLARQEPKLVANVVRDWLSGDDR